MNEVSDSEPDSTGGDSNMDEDVANPAVLTLGQMTSSVKTTFDINEQSSGRRTSMGKSRVPKAALLPLGTNGKKILIFWRLSPPP